MSEAFDHIPFEDLVKPFSLLGSGSFGSVYRSTYLGLPVALKQITPSKDYDVNKYFEREWRLMREARHPNVVLYLGLSTSPNDGVVYIVSEFIEGGNLRSYIYDKKRPFGWTMRISFMTDIVRALAYLHARKCIHRDLKPENLLLTSNGRVKITDFGFARIAPRSQDEQKRLTFCGTDSYMSPEVLIGDSFNLPTDVYSLGIILCEVMSRTLADDTHFKRTPPTFSIDEHEVRASVNEGCPSALVDLALDCMKKDPSERPVVKQILERMRAIEMEIFERDGEKDLHVGSVKFATGGRMRPKMAPRIPSFGAILNGDPLTVDTAATPVKEHFEEEEDTTSSDEEDDLLEAALRDLGVDKAGGGNGSAYSTTVVKGAGMATPTSMSSVLTIRASSSEMATANDGSAPNSAIKTNSSVMSVDTYHTAASGASTSSSMSIAAATIGADEEELEEVEIPHSTIKSLPQFSNHHQQPASPPTPAPILVPSLMYHRFTMIKPGTKSLVSSTSSPPTAGKRHSIQGIKKKTSGSLSESFGWSPFGFFRFGAGSKSKGPEYDTGNGGGSGGGTAKCDLCHKKLGLGFKTVLECDDCGLRVHVKCGEYAPKDCGLHAYGNAASNQSSPASTPPEYPNVKSTPRTKGVLTKSPPSVNA